jgi:type II secretory pathway component HofQ
MKPHILCALAALLPSSLLAIDRITVEAMFIEGKARRALPHDLKQLNDRRGVDILTAPHVTTRSGQPTQVEITREFHATSVAPSKHPQIPQGVILRVTPHAIGNRIAYTAHVTFRALDSVTGVGVPPVSTFTTREIYASGTPKPGEEVWLDLPARGGEANAVRLVFRR